MPAYRRPQEAAAGDAIPFFYEGALHLFFLSSPSGTLDYPERVRTSWQHVRSSNLVEWEVLPAAIEPGPEGSVDGGGIWTGSVVEHEGLFHLFYTGHRVGAEHPQTICLATSSDLVTFTRHPGNPLLLPTSDCEAVDWRDPYVFYNEQEERWWMLIAARGTEGPHWRRGVIKLATSTDLLRWTVEPDPLYAPGTTYCPECPELWELDGTWYLVYSAFSEDVGTVYRVADSPRGPFRTPQEADLGGRRWYAAKSAPWQGARAFFGWVHDRVDSPTGPRWLWGGDFALPRLVEAAGPGSLRVRAANGALDAFGPTEPVASGPLVALGETRYLTAEGVLDGAVALIDLRASGLDADELGIQLASDELGAGWRLAVRPRQGSVTLSREPRPLDDFWADLTGRSADYREVDGPIVARAQLGPERDQVQIVLLLHGGVLEAYINDQVALTHRIEPGVRLAVAAFVTDGRAELTLSKASSADLRSA